MEVTKWLKPSVSVSRIGDSASVQAVTRVNAEQALYGAFEVKHLFHPAFTGSHTDFWRGLHDSDITISSLSWIERGDHGAPEG